MDTNRHELAADELRQTVLAAAEREDVRAAVLGVYERLQREIEKRRPVCVMSGRCCRFEEFGHRLFVTTMELATFVAALAPSERDIQSPQWDGAGCPFQAGKMCRVHTIRPFGCRVFFCDSTAQTWQEDQYQRFHQQLKNLHQEMGVPYYYLEWREALARVLGLTPAHKVSACFSKDSVLTNDRPA